MTAVNNVKIYWGDGEGENYQFEKNPHISFKFNDIRFPQVLGNQLTADYWLGVQAIFKLTWRNPRFFRGDQYEKLIEIYNQFDAVCIYPEPDSLPDVSFLVRIANQFDFDYVEGATVYGYQGILLLEGVEVLDEIPNEIVLMCP